MRYLLFVLLAPALLASSFVAPVPSVRAAPAVSPATAVVTPGDQAVFSSVGAPATGWAVLGGGGTITPAGLYTAPLISSTVTLRATTAAGPADATVLVRNWAPLADAPLPNVSMNTLAFGPDGLLYAGTEDHGVYRLDPQQGGFWQAMRGRDGGLSTGGMRVRAMVFDSLGNHYLATNGGIFRRLAGRTFWQHLSAGLPEAMATEGAQALLIIGNTVYAGFENGAVYGWDVAGAQWALVGAAAPSARPIYSLANAGNRLFAGSDGVVHSIVDPRNPAARWAPFTPSANELVQHMAFFEGKLFAGVRNRGILVFDGTAWVESRRHGGNGFAIADGKLYAGGSRLIGAHVLRLDGDAWVSVTPDNGAVPGDAGVRSFAIGPDGMIVIGRVGEAFRSARGLALPRPERAVADLSITPDGLTVRVGTSRYLSANVALDVPPLPEAAHRLFLPLLANLSGAAVAQPSPTGGVHWISSNPAVATVDARGMVTGVAPGTAVITAIAAADPTRTATITVTISDPAPAVTQIRLRAVPNATVEVGRSIALYADVEGTNLADGVGVVWSSSNPAVATVSAGGIVSGVAPGTAVITARARADAGVTATITITVAPSSLSSLATGGRWQNISAGLPPNPKDADQGLTVLALTMHNGRLFAGTEGEEVWAYGAGGWVRVAAVGSLGAYDPRISAFAHTNANALYALSSRGGVYRYNADNDWTQTSVGLPDATLSNLQFAGGALHLLAESDAGVQLYRFDGSRWNAVGTPLTAPRPVGGLAYAGERFYVGMDDGNVYRLDPGGAWVDVAANLPDARSETNPGGIDPRDMGIVQLTAAPDGSLHVITDGARNRLYRLAPGATQWELLVRYEYQQGAAAAAAWIGDGWYLGGENRVNRLSGTTRVTLGAYYGSAPDIRVRAVVSPDGGATVFAAGMDGAVGSSVWWITPDPLAPVRDSDLAVSTSTYLGNGLDADEANAVDIAPDGSVVVAGSSEASEEYGVEPTLLLGGGSGLITRLDATGTRVLSRTRLGRRISDMEIDRAGGRIAVASNLGVSLLTAAADRVVWHVPLSNGADRVAVTTDGTVAVISGNTVIGYTSAGAEMGRVTIDRSQVNDVAVDAATGSIFVTGLHNQTLPSGLPVQTAYLYSYSYDFTMKWRNWDWPGAQLTGNEADARGYRVAMGRDGMLYFLGESAGGNSMFRWQPRDLSADGNLVSYDIYSSGVNSSSAHFAYVARLNPADGAVLKGQFAVPRLTSGLSNTYRVRAIAADEQGTVYIGGQSAFAIESRDSNSIAGRRVATYAGGDGAVLVVSPDFSTRLVWTTWAAGGQPHGTMVNGIAAAQGVAAMAANAENGRLITVNPLPDGGAPSATLAPANPDGFLAVWPIRVGR